jgi:hypothetical protein
MPFPRLKAPTAPKRLVGAISFGPQHAVRFSSMLPMSDNFEALLALVSFALIILYLWSSL